MARDTFEIKGVPTAYVKEWDSIEHEVINSLMEERCLNDEWVFKNMFRFLVVKNLKVISQSHINCEVILDHKKYYLSLEKRQSIWFMIECKGM